MRPNRTVLFLALIFVAGWVDSLCPANSSPVLPLLAPDCNEAIYPFAISYRQQLLEKIELAYLTPSSIGAGDWLVPPRPTSERGLVNAGWPLYTLDVLYVFMSLQR